MLKNCSPKNGSRLRRVFSNLAIAFVLLLMMAISASAYTLVFRDGRRMEIPSEFTLTKMTLTYEVSPGFSKTIQLIMIDVAKTERVNNEAPGSFFQHAAQAQVAASSPPPTKRAGRTLTNIDLEPIRQRRIESERNYEKRRIELGLPSIEETRQRQAAEEEATLALARRRAAEDARNEAYWRDRASALRSDFNSVDAQIEYLHSRSVQNQGPIYNYGSYPNVYGSYPNVYGSYPNVYGSIPTGLPYASPYERRRSRNQGTVAAPRAGAPNRGVINTGSGALRPQVPTRRHLGFGAQLISPYTTPYQPFVYGNSYNQDDRLDNLLMRRAELEALWRALEDDARKAKAPQAWLLP